MDHKLESTDRPYMVDHHTDFVDIEQLQTIVVLGGILDNREYQRELLLEYEEENNGDALFHYEIH